MSGPKTGVRLIGVTGWFECDGSGVHHEVCSFLSDGRATKSAVVCDSWEQAEHVLADHKAMEEARARGVWPNTRADIAYAMGRRSNASSDYDDYAAALLDAAKEADSE